SGIAILLEQEWKCSPGSHCLCPRPLELAEPRTAPEEILWRDRGSSSCGQQRCQWSSGGNLGQPAGCRLFVDPVQTGRRHQARREKRCEPANLAIQIRSSRE